LLASIQLTARLFGVELRKSSLSSRPDIRLAHFLSNWGVTDIIDVGANEGQFAQSMFGAGFRGSILSVEPQPDICQSLQARALHSPGLRWKVADPVALSDSEGQVEFHLTQSRAASSILRPNAGAASQVAEIVPEKTIVVKTMTLDALLARHSVNPRTTFLKIDVQGAEKLVLAGATSTLPLLRGALVELSTATLYDSQPLLPEILAFMTTSGFEIWDVDPGYRNGKTGKMEQCDVTFFRKQEN
jgi:FkbM family methyltransferase